MEATDNSLTRSNSSLLENSLLTLSFPLLVSGDSREESICCGIRFTDISFAFLSFAKFNN